MNKKPKTSVRFGMFGLVQNHKDSTKHEDGWISERLKGVMSQNPHSPINCIYKTIIHIYVYNYLNPFLEIE